MLSPRELGTLSNLTFLSLSDNQLTGALPPELSSLTELSSLYLGGNQLTGEIPRWLGNLDQLVILTVNDNQFTGSVPPELGNLIPGLEELFLAGNQLTGCIPNVLRGVERNDFDELALLFCTDTQPDPGPTPESPECLESLPDEMTVNGRVGHRLHFQTYPPQVAAATGTPASIHSQSTPSPT